MAILRKMSSSIYLAFIVFAILVFVKTSTCFNFTEFLLSSTKTSWRDYNETATITEEITYEARKTETLEALDLTHGHKKPENTNYNRSKARDGDYMKTSSLCSPCGVTLRNRIVGGREGNIRELPWTVDIKKAGIQHCGGSIINQESILTAAHCIKGHDISKFKVIAMVSNVFDPDAVKLQIQSAVTHPQFDPETYDYDVAILFLAHPIPKGSGIIPICLPEVTDDPTGQTAIVSGWGALEETANVAPEKLRKLPVPVVTNDECELAEGLKGQKITDRMLCAGYLGGSKDACTGDSGGPLVWERDGVYKQVGIVSWGIGCARPQFYGVYTRVTALLDWIKANRRGQC